METTVTEVPATTPGAPPPEKRVVEFRIEKKPVAKPADGTQSKTGDQPDKPAESKPEEPKGSAFAALKRERQRADERIKAAEAKEAALAEREAKLKPFETAVESKDISKIMESFGLTDEKVVDLYIKSAKADDAADAAGKPQESDDKNPLLKELRDLRAKVEAAEKATKDREANEQMSAGVAKVVTEIGAVLATDKERWPLGHDAEVVKAASDGKYTDAARLAFDVAWEHFQATKENIAFADALDAVEDHLIMSELRKKYPDLKSRRALLGAKTEPPTESVSQSGKPAASPAATGVKRTNVTNNASSASPTAATPGLTKGQLADRKFKEKLAALVSGKGG